MSVIRPSGGNVTETSGPKKDKERGKYIVTCQRGFGYANKSGRTRYLGPLRFRRKPEMLRRG